MSPDEKNIFSEFNQSSQKLRLLEENYRPASQLVNDTLINTAICVPRVIATEGDDVTLWEFIEGLPLDQMWETLAQSQKESIKLQVKDFIARLWTIPTPADFAVGSLCSTHELLCDNYHPLVPHYAQSFWHTNGPYKIVAEYYDVSQTLYYDYKPTRLVSIPIESSLSRDCLFSVCESGLVTAKPVLDH